MYILAYLNKKNIFLSLFLAFFLLGVIGVSLQKVSADDTGINKAVNGLTKSATKGYLGTEGKANTLNGHIMTSIPQAIGKVIGAGLSLIGVLFLILMIYGGFRWMIARGNDTEIEKAKHLIEAAITGLIIVVAAYALTAYVGSILTGS